MLKSVLLLLSGNTLTSVMLFARNLLIARLISVEDYGIAATFAVSMAIVEMMSTLGLHQLIVQDKDGNDPELQAALQGFHLFRGSLSSLALFLLAGPIARFLSIEEVTWAFQVLAIIPLARGFMHFDIYRFQREMSFLPLVLNSFAPAFAALIIVWPLYHITADYKIMLYSVVLQGILGVLASHISAKRRYVLAFRKDVMVRALSFGWPLLANNIFLFAVFHGEKLVVGRVMGMEPLAIYAMGFTLTLTPTLIFAKSAQSFFLPQLSAAKEDRARFLPIAMATLQSSLLGGLLVVVLMVLVGAPMIKMLLGSKYDALIPLITWMAVLHAVRVFKAGSSVIALSNAHTTNAMIANIFRIASIPLSWYALTQGGTLSTVLIIATCAEAMGYATSLALNRRRILIPLKPMVLPIFFSALTLFAALINSNSTNQNATHSQMAMWTMIATAIFFILSLISMRALFKYIMTHKMVRNSTYETSSK